MKTSKKITLLTAISIATAFTLSCSDDKDETANSDFISCKGTTILDEPFNGSTNAVICLERPVSRLDSLGLSISEAKEECEKGGDDTDFPNGAEFINGGCPSGYAMKCRSRYYFYGSQFEGVTCDEFFGQ